MKTIGDVLWNIGFFLFIVICCVLLVYNEKQIDIGLRNEAYKCIEQNYSVMIGERIVDMTTVENKGDFLEQYKVIDIDDTNKVIVLRKCK